MENLDAEAIASLILATGPIRNLEPSPFGD
jgi:hypothetical protein